MTPQMAALVGLGVLLVLLIVVLVQLRGLRGAPAAEAEAMRRHVSDMERAVLAGIAHGETAQVEGAGRLAMQVRDEQMRLRMALGEERDKAQLASDATRLSLERSLREIRETTEAKLGQIEKSVNEQLHQAVEQQMTASFARVIEQFAEVQRAMGDVQAVTAQIGDLRRLFGNVKTRGGWGETQVRAMLDDMLPPGSYEVNRKLHEGSDDLVEFAVLMPMRGGERVYLPVDAKFPSADYERLLVASETGDADGEKAARAGLERAVRVQARRIRDKYIHPPLTVEFGVMYLPTDGLYAEVARIAGLIDEVGRDCRVLIMGPSLLPAMLRTIQLGQVTLALEQKSGEISLLLGATKAEMQKIDKVFDRLGKQVLSVGQTIEDARVRTRAVQRKLRTVEMLEAEEEEEEEE